MRLAAAVLSALALLAAPAAAQSPGAPGSGDPFFPQAGNGGYDARHYVLDLDHAQAENRLSGVVTVVARATQDLSSFNLDLRDFYAVSRVVVNGRIATSTHAGQELTVTPARPLREGRRFVVVVTYSGQPQAITDPDDGIEGWVPTDDGAFVVAEPQGAPGWFPVNDSPRDKATFDFAITVPAGSTAMANGIPVGRTDSGDTTTWRWAERRPMAPYLATATNGPFETRFGRLPNGLPVYDAVDPDTRVTAADPPNPALAWERLAPTGEIVDFLAGLFGRYPFDSVGGVMDWAPNVGYSLESQTRANYWRIVGPSTVVHEIAHQWWGNAVTLETWPDIWLNEGFATWSEWIYDERHGGQSAQAAFDALYATAPDTEAGRDLWFPAPAALPGPEVLFSTPVYDRGAMTLQALRAKVGDPVFFAILRAWYREHRYGNASTQEFIALAERVSDRALDDFFRVWLFEEGRPASW